MAPRVILAVTAASLLAAMLVFVVLSSPEQAASVSSSTEVSSSTDVATFLSSSCKGDNGCPSDQRCKGWTWFTNGKCIDKLLNGANCVIDHNLASYACKSRLCHGVHWVEGKVKVGPILVPVAGTGEAYCMPVTGGKGTGFNDGTHCAYDNDCKKDTSYCWGGGLLQTWVGTCTACPSYCGNNGCHSCDNTKAAIKCNDGPVNFWAQTMGCVPTAAKNDYNKLQQCILEEEEAETGTTNYAAAQKAAKDNLRKCMLAAVAEGKQCFQNATGCNFQFGCLQFGDMAIASGALASVAQDAVGGRRLLQVDKTQTKAWLLRNFSKTIQLLNGSNTKDVNKDFSATETHSAAISFFGSANFEATLHVGMNFADSQYDITFHNSGIQLDLSTTMELAFHAAVGAKKDDGSGTIYSHMKEYAITDETGGLCADPSGDSCLAKQIYSELYMLGEVPVMVQVSYQVKTLVNFTAEVDASFSAQLNYSQFFGFEELGVSISNGKASWTHKADSLVPEVSHKLVGDASGVIDFQTLVGVELTVDINGVMAKTLIGAWGEMSGDFDIHMLLEGTGKKLGNIDSEFCASGHLKAGLAPGLRLEAGTGLVDVLESFVSQCGPAVSKNCDTKLGKVADCWVNAVGEFDPCKDAKKACQILGDQAQKLIEAPKNEGYFPLGADKIQLNIPIFDKETKPCVSKKAKKGN